MKITNTVNYLLVFIYLVTAILLIFNFNGVGQEADSITHFLMAKYAPQHPHLYLNHWGKPVFTFLASPFAQFGFQGIKLFNVICVGINLVLIQLIAKKLNFRYPVLAALFYLLFPLSLSTTFSGLTEPLFAVFLLFSIYFMFLEKVSLALLLISFTPFIRSEGLVIVLTFAAYLTLSKQWKKWPLLLVGHLVLGLLGSLYYKDLLWVFHKIPYANLGSPYGEGNWLHFFDKMTYVCGIPLVILFWIGLAGYSFEKANTQLRNKPAILIPLCFVSFFVAHSIFWSLGIFNSMGLKRVFAAVTPLMAILALWPIEKALSNFDRKSTKAIVLGYLGFILVFPFTKGPAATEFLRDLNLTEKQQSLANFELIPDGRRVVYADPYLSLKYDINPFNPEEYLELHQNNLSSLKKWDLIIWDNWHAAIDNGIEERYINEKVKQGDWIKIKSFHPYYAVYLKQ